MKKFHRLGVMFLMVILAASGCGFSGSPRPAGPGHVLGLDQAADTATKVVTFNVVGKGLEPENALTKGEARLMAERAAVADGYRQMVEKIRGVYVDAYTKAGFGKVDMDMITTKTQSWLRGVRVMEIRDARYGITEAHMSLSINFARNNMVWWPSGLGHGLASAPDQKRHSAASSGNPSGN